MLGVKYMDMFVGIERRGEGGSAGPEVGPVGGGAVRANPPLLEDENPVNIRRGASVRGTTVTEIGPWLG